MKTLLSLCIILTFCATAGAQWRHHGGYYYNSSYGSQAYTQSYTPGYYQPAAYGCGYTYVQGYYSYTPYYAPSVAAPAYKDVNPIDLLLKAKSESLASLQKTNDFVNAAHLLGYDINSLPVQAMPYAVGTRGYGLDGHYYQQFGARGQTVYGYSEFNPYAQFDLNQPFLVAGQLVEGSKSVYATANQGFQELVNNQADRQFQVEKMKAQREVAMAVLESFKNDNTLKEQGFKFKITQEGVQTYTDNTVTPAVKAEFSAILKKDCMGCHSGKKIQGGLDLSQYASFTKEQIDNVMFRLTTSDEKKRMPRLPNGGAGPKVTGRKLALFQTNPLAQ